MSRSLVRTILACLAPVVLLLLFLVPADAQRTHPPQTRPIVYYTKAYGQKYHTAFCGLIRPYKNHPSLAWTYKAIAVKAGLQPCTVCKP